MIRKISPGFYTLNPIPYTLFLLLLSACSGPQVTFNRNYDFSRVGRVAVSAFSGTGGEAASDFLTQALLAAGADVVERQRLQALLEEADLKSSGILEPEVAKKVGRILGVDAIFVGTVNNFSPPQSYLVYAGPGGANPGHTTIVTEEEDASGLKSKKKTTATASPASVVVQPVTPLAGRYVYTQGPAFGVPGGTIVTSVATIGLSARMVDVETGSVLWSAHQTYEGFDLDSALRQVTTQFVRSLSPVWPSK